MVFKHPLLKKLHFHWSKCQKYDRFLVTIALIGLIVIGISLLVERTHYILFQFLLFLFVLILLIAFLTGKAEIFVRDWTPPLFLILMYECLRSIIPKVNPFVHFQPMIKFDQFIFGQLPNISLQNLLFEAFHLHWYDYLGSLLYSSHFIVPLIIAFIFWLTDRENFENYTFCIIGVSYLAFLTYLLFPAAPPWLAAQSGVIATPINHVTEIVLTKLSGSLSLPITYKVLKANLTAAVPSLHTAYPILTALFISKKYPKLSLPIIFYALAICFALVYLGEHYIFDIILGIIFALAVYLTVHNWHRLPHILYIFKNNHKFNAKP